MTVSSEWARIVAWCDVHAPVTRALLDHPDQETIDKIAATEPALWLPEVVEFMRVQGGDSSKSAVILPGMIPLSAQEMRNYRLSEISAWTSVSRRGQIMSYSHESLAPAGSATESFLPEFIPVATNNSGVRYYVDTRPGALQGCVREWNVGLDDGQLLTWSSIEDLLHDTADALLLGSLVGRRRPKVINGTLDWVVARKK